MKTIFSIRFAAVILCISLAILSGCASSKPTRFYTLSSLVSSEKAIKATPTEQDISIGIRPVRLPEYLDRPQIITLTSTNKLKLAEFDKWAEPLNENISRVLAGSLSTLLSTDRVFIFPWNRALSIEYRVAVDVIRFEGTLGERIVLKANWTVFGDYGKKEIMTRTTSYTERIEGQDYGAMVAAMSRTLEGLSQDIAHAIKSQSHGTTE